MNFDLHTNQLVPSHMARRYFLGLLVLGGVLGATTIYASGIAKTPSASIAVTPDPTPVSSPLPEATVPLATPTSSASTSTTSQPTSPKPTASAGAIDENMDLELVYVNIWRIRKDQTTTDLSNPYELGLSNLKNGSNLQGVEKVSDPATEANHEAIVATVKNNGRVPAFNVTYQAFYNGVLIGTVTKDRIDQGTMHTVRIANLPMHVLGSHKIEVKINAARKPAERTYDNNQGYFNYTVVEPETRW